MSFFSGASQGAGLASAIGMANPLVGAVGGAISGIISANKEKELAKKKLQEEEKLYKNQALVEAMNTSKATLAKYDVNGVQGNHYFAYGGELNEGGSTNQIAGDMFKFNGDSHEEGGINIGNGNEVEGGETIQPSEARIYSDRLKISPSLIGEIKSSTGVKVGGTYADVSAKMGKLIREVEPTDNEREKNTKNLMNQRYKRILDMVFADQQSKNNSGQSNENQEFKNGGLVKKYALGDLLNKKLGAAKTKFDNLDKDQLTGNLLNLGNFLSNKSTLNKVKTDQKGSYVSTSPFVYQDNSELSKKEIGVDANNAVKNINRSSSQNNAGAIGDLYARKFDANNAINSQSAANKAQAQDAYSSMVAGVNSQNAAMANQIEAGNIERQSQLQADKVANRTAFAEGVLGNMQTGKLNQLEQDKITFMDAYFETPEMRDRFFADKSDEFKKRNGIKVDEKSKIKKPKTPKLKFDYNQKAKPIGYLS